MKKIACIFLIVFICFLTVFTSYAQSNYLVNGENIEVKQGTEFLVPISLKNNKGIMGFKLKIKYPANQLELKDVSSGSVTKTGLFNTTITDFYSVNGSFDVLWSDTENCNKDGTLTILTFKAKDTSENGKYSISVTYSQEDTFDDGYKDVKLNCSPVSVTINDGATANKTSTTKTQDKNSKKEEIVSDDFLIAAVNSVTDSFGTNDLNTLDEAKQKVALELVNNKLDSFSQSAVKFKSFEELKAGYIDAVKSQSVKNILASTDDSVILAQTEKVLKKYNAETFAQIPSDKQEEAVKEAINFLSESGADTSGLQNVLDSKTAAEILDKTITSAKERQDVDANKFLANKNSSNKYKITALIIGAVAVIIAVVILYIFKFKKIGRKNK